MSNRTDYANVARSLRRQYGMSEAARVRIESELHNAHVAGQEGSPCGCSSCERTLVRPARPAEKESRQELAAMMKSREQQRAEDRHAERHGHK